MKAVALLVASLATLLLALAMHLPWPNLSETANWVLGALIVVPIIVALLVGAVAFNRKIIDIAQRNVNSGFDLAKSLAGAKNLSEMVELQAAYWQKLLGALKSQAEEVRALSTKMAAAAGEPLKEQGNAAWMSCARQTEWLAPRWKYATGQS